MNRYGYFAEELLRMYFLFGSNLFSNICAFVRDIGVYY